MLSGTTESCIASASLSNKGDQYFLNMLAIQEWKTKVCILETFRSAAHIFKISLLNKAI